MSGYSVYVDALRVGAVTAVFVILMIYRSLFSMREDDQLFLNQESRSSKPSRRKFAIASPA